MGWSSGHDPGFIKRHCILGCLIWLLIGNSVIIGASASSCSKGCPNAETKFKYEAGNVYEYNVESIITISLAGTGSAADETTVKLLAHANVYSEGNCNYVLQLDKIAQAGTKDNIRKQYPAQKISKPVRFTMSDGKLEPQLCADSTDLDYLLNIKRAIISMFQSSTGSHNEVDIFGVCPTSFSVSKSGNIESVTKTRNLNGCSNREKVSNGLISGGIINENAGIKSSSLLNGQYIAEQKIVNGIIEHVDLVEDYVYVPLSQAGGNVKAKVKTVLKYLKTSKGNAPAIEGETTESIIFEHPHAAPMNNLNTLKKVFEMTVAQLDGYTKSDAALQFTDLIRLMRSADANTLTSLSGIPHPNKNLAKNVYFDALLHTGTSESVKSISGQIPKLSLKEKRRAFISFNFVEHIHSDALQAAINLLKSADPSLPNEGYLSCGNLLNKYCNEHQCDQNKIESILKVFVDNLKDCKSAHHEDEDRFVSVLKGIRNTKRLIGNSAVQAVLQCAKSGRTARLRVAALEAFHAGSCNPLIQERGLSILKDRNEDSEIRIEAYLALVSCPNAQLANQLAEIINTETVYQVGGFILSHLRSIRDSTDPTRENALYYLGNIRVTKKFPIDPRRYSFNSELSYSLPALGVGASADYSLIYSQNGFLPRSGRLNLTAEVFGRNLNVLELDVRQENLEHYLEYYFGPKGYFNDERGKELLTSLTDRAASAAAGAAGAVGGGRRRRSVNSEQTNKFAKTYKNYDKYPTKNDLHLDYSLKMFGSELMYLSLGDNLPLTLDDITNFGGDMFNRAKEAAKKFEHTFHCHSLLVDAEIVYPTGIGFPLELVAQAASASTLNVGLEADFDNMFQDLLNSKVRVKMVPSANINANAQFRVVTGALTTGIRITTNLHSATGGDVHLQLINNGDGFNLDIELPRTNIDFIELNYDTEFFVTEPESPLKTFPMKSRPKKTTSSQLASFDQLKMFGITVYFDLTLPDVEQNTSPMSVLTGPIHLLLQLECEKHMTLKGLHENFNDKETWQLTYDTPGSSQPHTSQLKFELALPRPGSSKIYGRVQFDNPKKRLALEAGVLDSDKEFTYYGQYEDDNDMTTAKIGFTKNGQELRPLIYMKSSKDNKVHNDIGGYKADGKVLVTDLGPEGKKYQYKDFRVINPAGKATVVNGWTTISSKGAEFDLSINDSGEDYQVKSLASIEPGTYALNGYLVTKKTGNTYGGGIKIGHGNNIAAVDLNIKAAEYSFDLNEHYEWKYNNDGNSEKPDKQDGANEGHLESLKFKNMLVIKEMNNDALYIRFNGRLKEPKNFEYDFEARRLKKKLGFYIKFEEDGKSSSDYKLDVNGKLNQHHAELKLKSELKGGKAHLNSNFVSSWGSKLTLSGQVGPHLSLQDIYIDLNGIILLTASDKENKWLLKAIGSGDKTSGEFKVSSGDNEVISYTAELNRGQDKPIIGKINFSIKDNLVAKGDFKYGRNGRGDLSVLINLKKLSKKMKLDSKFTIYSPKYDIETTILFDPDKDKTKKIYYKTENLFDKSKLSTNHILELGTEKYTFNLNLNYKGNLPNSGEIDGSAELVLPTGRQFKGEFKRSSDMDKKETIKGKGELKLTDLAASGEKRELKMNMQFSDLNMNLKTLNGKHHIHYESTTGKNINIDTIIKHLTTGKHFKMAELIFDVNGSLLDAPIIGAFKVDEYCHEHAVFSVNGKYGNNLSGNLNGKYFIGSDGDNKPISYEIKCNLNAPKSEAKKYSLQSSGKYVSPQNENGQHEVEIDFVGQAGDKKVEYDVKAKGNDNVGSYHVSIEIPNHAPIKTEGKYNIEENENLSKYHYSVLYDCGEGNVVRSSYDVQLEGEDSLSVHYTLQSPYEHAKSIDLKFKAKETNEDTYTTNTQLSYNGKQYGLNTVLTLSEQKSEIYITCSCPEQTAKLSAYAEQTGERKGKAGVHIENVLDFDLQGSCESSFQNYDDFYLITNMNSNALKIDQLHIEVKSEKDNSGKGVLILVKDAKQNIINGKATYNVKQDKGKAIVEGQGSMQYYQQATEANFKLIRQSFNLEQDKEAGFSYNFDGAFGPKNIVSQLKVTTKNFHIKLAACEDKKQCTNFEIQSITTFDPNRPSQGQHEAMVLIDLRELGYPHEFELQSKTLRNGFYIEHEIESSLISNNNHKYQFLANLKPSNNRVQLKLPKREILLETVHKLPKEGFLGRYENSITFYIDKANKPNDKTQLSLIGDVHGNKNISFNAKCGLKFEHPTIRPLSVTGLVDLNKNKQTATSQLVFDVFREPNQKVIASVKYHATKLTDRGFNITGESHLKSAGLNFHYDMTGYSALSLERRELAGGISIGSVEPNLRAGAYGYLSDNKFEFSINGLDTEILHAVGTVNSKGKTKFESKFQVLGSKVVTLTGEADTTKLGFTLKQDGLLEVTGEIRPAKEMKLSATGQGKKLADARIALDPGHFLATTYDVNSEDISAFTNAVEQQLKQDTQKSREIVEKRFEQLRQSVGKQAEAILNSPPDFSKLHQSYKQHIQEILNELEADSILRSTIGAYKQTFEAFTKLLQDIVSRISDSYEKIYKISSELYAKLAAAFKDEIIPELKNYVDKVITEAGQLYSDSVQILTTTAENLLKALKSLEDDLNKIVKPFTELLKPVAELLNEITKTVGKELEDFWHEIESYYKSLPSFDKMFEDVRDKLSQVQVFEDILTFLNEIVASLEEYVAIEEGKVFLRKVHSYLDAKLKKQPVNDSEKLEEIYLSFLDLLRSGFKLLQGEGGFGSLFTPLPYAFEGIKTIPLWTGFKFSALNFLLNEKFDSFKTLLLFKPPFDLLPPYELRGHIADGQHIFTFDGEHMTFPGSCNYILAQDYVGNNFSVVANLKDGKMKTITVVDKENYIEVNEQGILKLNGKNSEFPVHKDDLHAWRRYYTISILSEYGVYVLCTTDLRICHVKVNGFYTGKTRGLLGNGNSEPYDDYTKPDGVIASDYATFGNSYGLENCPPVPFEDHSKHHEAKTPICQEFFGYDSSLVFAYPFIDPKPYREACEHATDKSSNKEDAACNIATVYASAGNLDDMPVQVPNRCLKCNPNTPEQHEVGKIFESKVPTNKADVAFVVDISIGKELLSGLVTPVVKDLRNQLKTRGITDTHISVIGYDLAQKYPQLYTSNGKINYNGNLENSVVSGPKQEDIPLTFGVQEVDKFLDQLRQDESDSLFSSDGDAFSLALDYPFRASASKVIVVLRRDPLEFSNILKSIDAIITKGITKTKGVSLHYIGPVSDLSVDGVPPEKIVGFNQRLVATVDGKDAKKRSSLKYKTDFGITLVHEDGGWIFALQNFKKSDSSKYTQQVSSSIAEHISKTEVISECICSVEYGLHAEDTCAVKSTQFLPAKRAAGKS